MDRFQKRPLALEVLESRAMLATFIVTQPIENLYDLNSGDNQLTLREAIAYVNGDTPEPGDDIPSLIDRKNGDEPIGTNDKIIFSSAVFGSGSLTSQIDLKHGGLSIDNPVTIEWAGAGLITINASTYDEFSYGSIFDIDTGIAEDAVSLKRLIDPRAANEPPPTLATYWKSGGFQSGERGHWPREDQ